MSKTMNRRNFLKMMGIGAGALGAGTVAGLTATRARAAEASTYVTDAMGMGMSRASGLDWQTMDAMHAEGVKIFLDNAGKDPGFWLPPMEYTMDGDIKVFDIEIKLADWEVKPGEVYPAMTYNGSVPGPTIRVTEGDTVRINFTNNMPNESHGVHFHGLLIPNSLDGVPYVTQQPITPGSTMSYEWKIRNYGSHMYHSHHNSAEQTNRGLLGAFIIDPADASVEPEFDSDYTLVLNDSAMGYTLNGKSFPYTQPIIAKKGEKVRIRYMNEGFMIHPMHLHGIPQKVVAKDGFFLPQPFMCDTLNVAPGERWDVIVEATEVGAWAFHCHILTHAESANGMFGMVTVFLVQEA